MERLMLKMKPLALVVGCSGRRHYHGPYAYITENAAPVIQVDEGEGKGKG